MDTATYVNTSEHSHKPNMMIYVWRWVTEKKKHEWDNKTKPETFLILVTEIIWKFWCSCLDDPMNHWVGLFFKAVLIFCTVMADICSFIFPTTECSGSGKVAARSFASQAVYGVTLQTTGCWMKAEEPAWTSVRWRTCLGLQLKVSNTEMLGQQKITEVTFDST